MREGTASETARRVAAHRRRCPRVYAPGGRPHDDEALCTDVAASVEIREGRMHRYLCRRTSFFDHVVVDALDEGVRQVVLVGAGYDSRAMRYTRSGVTWFEVDHPATQADKLERVARLGLSTDGIVFVPADLTVDDVATWLVAAGVIAAAPSLLVVEGLASYLDEDVLEAALASLRTLAHGTNRLAVSVELELSDLDVDAAARAAAFQGAVASMGEPIRNRLSVEALDDLLRRAGWRRIDDDVNDALSGADGRLGLLVAAP
jgi:methyltransferase (TIGR00027 family)